MYVADKHVPPLPYIMLQPNQTTYSFLKCQAISYLRGFVLTLSPSQKPCQRGCPANIYSSFKHHLFYEAFSLGPTGWLSFIKTCHVPVNVQDSSVHPVNYHEIGILSHPLTGVKTKVQRNQVICQVHPAYRRCTWASNSNHCDLSPALHILIHVV